MVPVLVTGFQTTAWWKLPVAHVKEDDLSAVICPCHHHDLQPVLDQPVCSMLVYYSQAWLTVPVYTCVYFMWFSVAWGSVTFWWQSYTCNCSMFCTCIRSGSPHNVVHFLVHCIVFFSWPELSLLLYTNHCHRLSGHMAQSSCTARVKPLHCLIESMSVLSPSYGSESALPWFLATRNHIYEKL